MFYVFEPYNNVDSSLLSWVSSTEKIIFTMKLEQLVVIFLHSGVVYMITMYMITNQQTFES